MDVRDQALSVAARLLEIADALEPGDPKHLVMTSADLRALLEAGQVPTDTIDEVMHHAFHEYGAAKLVALEDVWAPPQRCGVCSGRAIPIVYGMPPAELGALADLGIIELAGCIVDVDAPSYRCASCGHTW